MGDAAPLGTGRKVDDSSSLGSPCPSSAGALSAASLASLAGGAVKGAMTLKTPAAAKHKPSCTVHMMTLQVHTPLATYAVSLTDRPQ